MTTPRIEEIVNWKDGVIVEFEAYEMHTNEGGSEVWDNELSVFQRGIVLGDSVVGCDYELCQEDFNDGVWLDGINKDGSYHIDEYIRATLVEPEWLEQALTQAHQAGIDEAVEVVNRHGKQCDKNYHAECIEMIKEALQENQADRYQAELDQDNK